MKRFAVLATSATAASAALSSSTSLKPTTMLSQGNSVAHHQQQHLTQSIRLFSSNGRMTHEGGFGSKLADIPIISGTTKTLTRDGEWQCQYALTEPMKLVVPKILRKHGFAEIEITREMAELFPEPTTGARTQASLWITVEDFQKTPWFRRYRPNNGTGCFASYECMKLLEAELVPPSMRNDPYSSLRKRHMEDQFMNEKSSEVHAMSIRRGELAKQTKGMKDYGRFSSRAEFLKFSKAYDEARGGQMGEISDDYHAWVQTVSKSAQFRGKN